MKGAVCQSGSSRRPSTTTAPSGTRIATACLRAGSGCCACATTSHTRTTSPAHNMRRMAALRIGRVAEVGGRCLENFVDQEQVSEECPNVNGCIEVVDHLGTDGPLREDQLDRRKGVGRVAANDVDECRVLLPRTKSFTVDQSGVLI